MELLCQCFYCFAHFRRDRKARKGWSKGNSQLLQCECWHIVNWHRLDFGIAPTRPRDDRVKSRKTRDGACLWPMTGDDAHGSGPRKPGNQPGEGDALLGWLQTKQATKMRWNAD